MKMKNYIKKNMFGILLTTFMFTVPILSFGDETIINPIKSKSITGLIKTILEGIIKIGMPVVVLAIIYSGFLFVSARGNSEKLGKAKDSLLYTLIGVAILLGSWAIAQLITDTVKAL